MRDQMRLGSRVGLGALQRSAEYHHRALRVEPRFVPAALALAQVELSLLDTARLGVARQMLRQSMGDGAWAPPELLLAWGRLEWLGGSLENAARAFERYAATGGSRALGLLELARTRLAQGKRSGDSIYYLGAALDDPEAIAGYRADLEPIAADSNIREFDLASGPRRAAFLHRFWTDRDDFELRTEGERLREHYRRLRFARLNFPLTVSRRFYGRLDAYRSGNTEIDDRGIIYLRQGRPAERLRPFVFGVMPNESWRYVRSDGDLLFHFSAGYDGNGGGDLYDYRLVQSVLDLRGAADAPRDQLILSRQSLSPLYSRMLSWGRFGAANIQARERNIGITSIEVGTTTDSYELHFPRRLSAVADLVSVGRRAGGSLAHFVFGITGSTIRAVPTPDGARYTVRIRLVALDRHDRSVATLDTTVTVSHTRVLSEDEWLVGRAELILPGGRWSYRAALQQGDSAGVVLPRDSVRVAPTSGPSLGLSDIALGSPGKAVPWITDAGDTVLLAPSALFRREAQVETYYEVTGAVPQQLYRHEIAVWRAGARDPAEQRPLVTLSFDEAAAGEIIRSRRTVRLEGLKRGSYVVEVKVTAPDGRFQVRRRVIRILAGR
jgi:GWxTD domain-containing protein